MVLEDFATVPYSSDGPACSANHLLRGVEADSFRAIRDHLQTLELPFGRVIYEPEETIPFVYFPHNAVISLLSVLSNGKTVEMTTVGCEGIVGFVDSLGNCQSIARYVVQVAGTVSRLPIKCLQQEIEINDSFRKLLFGYIKALLAQTFQAGVCNAAHSVEARCCRLMLTMRDRVGQDELPLTHEFLAEMLGVQRPAVSIVARHLQQARLIKQGRGVITITDGAGLEGMVCECYNMIRRNYEQL